MPVQQRPLQEVSVFSALFRLRAERACCRDSLASPSSQLAGWTAGSTCGVISADNVIDTTYGWETSAGWTGNGNPIHELH